MKIAVTGATGHIGVNLTLALVDKGYSLKAICRSPGKVKYLEKGNVEIAAGDILDKAFLSRIFKDVEVVIHLAGKISIEGDPDGSVGKTNVIGTRNVVEACLENKIKKLIHFSSIHAFHYTNTSPFVDESSPYANSNSFPYDQSKALGEQEVFRGIEQGLDAFILNPTGVIGPHDYLRSRTGELFRKLFSGQMPALIRGGFDWVDVRDLVAATLFILEKGANSRRYLLNGHWADFKQLAAICQDISRTPAPRIVLPLEVAMLGLPFIRIAQTFVKSPPLYTYESLMIIKNANRRFSSKLAQQELNYAPRPLKKSIEDIYAWQTKNKD